jgi:hypothetical protein
LDILKPLPRAKNRRQRDFLMALIGGNLLIYFGLYGTAGPFVAASIGFFYTVGLTWVMYAVMSRY